MPSFEHANSQPRARKDDHFRPGDAAEDDSVERPTKSITLGQSQLSWSDLAKEPEPEPEADPQSASSGPPKIGEEKEPEPRPEPDQKISGEADAEDAPAASAQQAEAAGTPTSQRIDDSHFPDPGPSLLQRTTQMARTTGGGRKRNRPASAQKTGLPAGHPGLVESPAAFEEKLSGRYADGKPGRPRKPEEEAAKKSGNDSAQPPREASEAKSRPKRSRNRKRKPNDGTETRRPGDSTGGGKLDAGRPGPKAEGGKPRSDRSGPRPPANPAPAAIPTENSGVVGTVKKLFRSIFGRSQTPEKEPTSVKRDEPQGKRRDAPQRRGSGQGFKPGPGQNRSQGVPGEQSASGGKRRRGKRGGRNRRGGEHRSQGKRSSESSSQEP